MHEIAHGLDPLPPEPRLAEQIPGDRGQMVRLTVPAAEQVHEGVLGKRFDRVLLGVTRHGLGFAAVVDERVRRQPEAPGRCDDAAAPVTKAVAIHLHRHRRIGDQVVGSHQIRCARVVHVQRQDHRRELLALVDQLVPQSYLHVFPSARLHVGRARAACVRRRCPRLPAGRRSRRSRMPRRRLPGPATLQDHSGPEEIGIGRVFAVAGDGGSRRKVRPMRHGHVPITVPHVAAPHQRRQHGAAVSRILGRNSRSRWRASLSVAQGGRRRDNPPLRRVFV